MPYNDLRGWLEAVERQGGYYSIEIPSWQDYNEAIRGCGE